MLIIKQVPVLTDNYVYILHDAQENVTAVVDPAVHQPVIDCLEKQGWSLDFILNTHHHFDHVGGNEALQKHYGAKVIGFRGDKGRIPGLNQTVIEGDIVNIGSSAFKVIEVFGHTLGHIAYYGQQDQVVFCGDTLFSLGCGRLFEGSPEQMWKSLCKLRNLPDATKVYCGHEYTESNLEFIENLGIEDTAFIQLAFDVRAKRHRGEATVPSMLGMEKQFNPFLKADNQKFKNALGLGKMSDIECFTHIRKLKDSF